MLKAILLAFDILCIALSCLTFFVDAKAASQRRKTMLRSENGRRNGTPTRAAPWSRHHAAPLCYPRLMGDARTERHRSFPVALGRHILNRHTHQFMRGNAAMQDAPALPSAMLYNLEAICAELSSTAYTFHTIDTPLCPELSPAIHNPVPTMACHQGGT